MIDKKDSAIAQLNLLQLFRISSDNLDKAPLTIRIGASLLSEVGRREVALAMTKTCLLRTCPTYEVRSNMLLPLSTSVFVNVKTTSTLLLFSRLFFHCNLQLHKILQSPFYLFGDRGIKPRCCISGFGEVVKAYYFGPVRSTKYFPSTPLETVKVSGVSNSSKQ